MLFHRRQHTQITLDTSCVVITDVVLNHLNEFSLTGELSAVIALPFQDAPKALHRAVINAMRHAGHKTSVSDENQLFETLLLGLKVKATTKEAMLKLYHKFGFDAAFALADIMKLAGVTSSPAGALIDKLKSAGLIEPVAGQGKGKYKFNLPEG